MFHVGANRLLVSSAAGSGVAAGCAALSAGGGFVCDGGGVWMLGDAVADPAAAEVCAAAGTVSARTDAATDSGPPTRETNSRIRLRPYRMKNWPDG